MSKLRLTKDDVFLILAVLATLTYSILLGRLGPDSIYYLIMATFSDANQLCMRNGELVERHACGYPVLIQLTSLIFDADLFVSSKLLNSLILVIHYCIFSHIFRSKRLALILTLLPFNIHISQYTMSENLILLSFSLYCLALFRIETKNNIDITSYTLVFIAILIGCLSRYALAPFSVFIFMASFIIIQRKALLLLPVFMLNALIFIVYLYFASLYSDRERIAAPESIALLSLLFYRVIGSHFKSLLLGFSPVLISNIKNIRLYKLKFIVKSNWGMFFTLLGVSYLAFSFILRAIIHYDPYDFRTVGFGGSLIVSGILITYRKAISKSNLIAVIISLAICQILLDTVNRYEIIRIAKGKLFDKHTINRFVDAQQNTRNNIVILIGDEWKVYVVGSPVLHLNLKYKDAFFQRIPGMPYYRPLNVDEFHSTLKGQKCRLIFSREITEKRLQKMFSEKFKTGLDEYADKYSPELAEFIIKKFNTKDTNCY